MNPILQALNQNNSIVSLVSSLKSGNPDALYKSMMQSNPQFRSFVEQNKNKTPIQIAQSYGLDINKVSNLIGAQMGFK